MKLEINRLTVRPARFIRGLILTSLGVALSACDGSTSLVKEPSQTLAQTLPNAVLAEKLVGIWNASVTEGSGVPDTFAATATTLDSAKYYVIEPTANGGLSLLVYNYNESDSAGQSAGSANCYVATQNQALGVYSDEIFSFDSQWLKVQGDNVLGYANHYDDLQEDVFAYQWTRVAQTEVAEFLPACDEQVVNSLPVSASTESPDNESDLTEEQATDNDLNQGESQNAGSAPTDQGTMAELQNNSVDTTPELEGNQSEGSLQPATVLQNRVPIPESGAYIGMNTGDEANGISVSAREQLLGYEMAVERIFYGNQHWTLDRINIDQVTNAYIQGRIPMVSYKVGAWKDVTAGHSDAIIDKLAVLIKESGIPMLLTFHHEAEDDACENTNPDCGEGQTAQDYIAMWRYIHNRFAMLKVENVSWNWVAMGWQWGPSGNDNVRNHIESMFPGTEYVDWMSADLYNVAGNCSLTLEQISKRWGELETRGQGWYDWASQFNKPLALSEWGTFDDALLDGRKAQWFRNARDTLKTWSNIKAVVYFDRLHDGCDWRLDTGGDAELDGYKDLISDPWFIKG